jgi:hypothetical protein
MDRANSFMPEPFRLLHNAVFFMVGVRLHRRSNSLIDFASNGWTYLALSVPVFACRAMLVQSDLVRALNGVAGLALAISGALFCWLLTFGFLGLALGRLNRPQPALSYLADSSYWVYLTHLPIVGLLQVDLHPVSIPAAWKFLIVLSVTMTLTLASYQLLVRHTFLGIFLHGKRSRNRTTIPSRPHSPSRLDLRPLGAARESASEARIAQDVLGVLIPHDQRDDRGETITR